MSSLPLEGWTEVIIDGVQLDSVGPAAGHPDLCRLVLAYPPATVHGAATPTLPRRIRLDVVCNCGQPLGTWYDSIDEKYPFWCDRCDAYVRDGRHPWSVTATIEEQP